MQSKAISSDIDDKIKNLSLANPSKRSLNPQKPQKIAQDSKEKQDAIISLIHEEPIAQKPCKKKKGKKKTHSFKELKTSESSPVLQWPKEQSYRYEFHLPSIKTLHSHSQKKMFQSPVMQKKLTLPRLDYSSKDMTNKLVQKFETAKSQKLQRQKFLNMMEAFESKLLDMSERSKNVKSEMANKQKAPIIKIVVKQANL